MTALDIYQKTLTQVSDPVAAAVVALARVIESEKASSTKVDGPYSVPKVAELLGVSKETVYRLCKDGHLDSTRIRGRVTVSQSQLAEYQRSL